MFKLEGLDDFEKKLRKISEGVERSVGGTQQVQLTEMMPPAFVKECTAGKFTDIDQLAGAYPGEPKTQEEFTAMFSSQDWNDFIKSNTSYDSWQDMINDAATKHVGAKVNKAIRDA